MSIQTNRCQFKREFELTLGQAARERESDGLKPLVGTLRASIPPGKAGPAAGSESCEEAGDRHCEAETARSNAVSLSPEISTRTEPSFLSSAGPASGCPHLVPKGQSGRAGVAE